ncbi:phytanoyl-CoA dioxygenase family protein [uncultured Cellulomonas sp.]|uniref:phytanoyl-CoA dioxygenase family protein n=1 Tax=uncultured Cellulomonas sp. TaxID=189682 RepID=UPI0028E8BD2B|nr:phytanoyl-CoA dioxygenase family protein [uncultured Cellulomonas sp.]
MQELVESSWSEDDRSTIRARLVEDGYVYLPGFLDAVEVQHAAAEIHGALRRVGWVGDAGDFRPAQKGLAFTSETFGTVYPEVQRLEPLHRLAHTERLLDLAGEMLLGEVFCHPAKVFRLASPRASSGFTTQAHQDYVAQMVCSDVLTVWTPVTTCTPSRQGIRILPGSHCAGFVPTDATLPGARPLYLNVDADDPRWATADFRPGDVVLFHGFTVHGGGPNTSDEFRVSIDVRYQRRDDPMLDTFARPHGWPRTPDWDVLCDGWSTRRWVELPPDVHLVAASLQDIASGDLVPPPSRLLSR